MYKIFKYKQAFDLLREANVLPLKLWPYAAIEILQPVVLLAFVQILSFSALTLLLGRHEGYLACKELGIGLFLVTIWLELCTTYSTSCHHHLHHP